jgi:hypothetical protein
MTDGYPKQCDHFREEVEGENTDLNPSRFTPETTGNPTVALPNAPFTNAIISHMFRGPMTTPAGVP